MRRLLHPPLPFFFVLLLDRLFFLSRRLSYPSAMRTAALYASSSPSYFSIPPRAHSRFPLILASFLFLSFLLISAAQPSSRPFATADPSVDPSADAESLGVEDNGYLRAWLPSTDNPNNPSIASLLDNVYEPMQTLIDYISQLDVLVTNETNDAGNENRLSSTCNVPSSSSPWNSEAKEFFKHRRLPVLDDQCTTDVKDVDVKFLEKSRSQKSKFLFDTVTGYTDSLSRAAPSIANAAKAKTKSWTDLKQVTRPGKYEYDQRAQNCTHDFVGFAAVLGQWYISTRITYRSPLLTLGEGKRTFLAELDTIRKSKIEPLELAILAADAKENSSNANIWNSGSYQRTNSILIKRSGAAFASEYGDIFPADNAAVQLALFRGKHETDRAFDATTASNIAILALPLAMNVVPVALIADVNSLGMLIYTLLTDVLTAIPLAIKGVEVLVIGSAFKYAAVTRITGGNFNATEQIKSKAAELWVARCRPYRSLTPKGIVLLSVALVFMIGGIIAEIVAKNWVQRRKRMAAAALMTRRYSHGRNEEYSSAEPLVSPQAAALFLAARESEREKHD